MTSHYIGKGNNSDEQKKDNLKILETKILRSILRRNITRDGERRHKLNNELEKSYEGKI